MVVRDYRDDVIEELAASEHHLAATCAGLPAVLSATLTHLHEQHIEVSRLRDRYHRLIEESRTTREELRRYTASTVGRAA